MTLAEQIAAMLARRARHLAAMTALNAATIVKAVAADGDTPAVPASARAFTDDEQTAFDAEKAGIAACDASLANLRSLEAVQGAAAVPVAAPPGIAAAPLAPTPGVALRAFKPFAGQGFVRMALAVARSKGNMGEAAAFASRWKDQTPEVEQVLRAIAMTGEMPADVLRAAVAAGTTGNATWAAPLVYAQNLAGEFIELLRPQTILGKLPLRAVPFNVSIPRQTAGVSAGWVGEGLSKPVGKLDFDRLPIPWAKVAIICVITQELAKLSDPSAEMLVRDDLINAIVQYLDTQFVDPTVTASAGLRPASITNGAATVPSTGATVATINTDLTAMLKYMAAANMPMTSPRWLMTPGARITLQNLRTVQEQYAFPEVNQMMLKGYPIIESNNIGTNATPDPDTTSIILGDWSQVLYASDPVIDLSSSSEASLQMDSAPATPPTPLVSMFQQNMLAIKAEQYNYWAKRHANAVVVLTGFPV